MYHLLFCFWILFLESYVNSNYKVYNMKMQYSTPKIYMEELHQKNASFPLKTDDFEPYAIGPAQFLVGFYSSRPDYKGFIRLASSQLRAANSVLNSAQLFAGSAGIDVTNEVQELGIQEAILGVSQHHDAITSSQRRHVHRDYIKQLAVGQEAVVSSLGRSVSALLKTADKSELTHCNWLNESVCETSVSAFSQGQNLAVVLVNPTGHDQTSAIKIPIVGELFHYAAVKVLDAHGNIVTSQMLLARPLSPHAHNTTEVEPQVT